MNKVKVGKTSRSRSLGNKLLPGTKGLVTRNAHMKYETHTFFASKVMNKVKDSKVDQVSRSRSLGWKFCYGVKSLVTRWDMYFTWFISNKKVFAYRQQRCRKGYDNSSPVISHGELKFHFFFKFLRYSNPSDFIVNLELIVSETLKHNKLYIFLCNSRFIAMQFT